MTERHELFSNYAVENLLPGCPFVSRSRDSNFREGVPVCASLWSFHSMLVSSTQEQRTGAGPNDILDMKAVANKLAFVLAFSHQRAIAGCMSTASDCEVCRRS